MITTSINNILSKINPDFIYEYWGDENKLYFRLKLGNLQCERCYDLMKLNFLTEYRGQDYMLHQIYADAMELNGTRIKAYEDLISISKEELDNTKPL